MAKGSLIAMLFVCLAGVASAQAVTASVFGLRFGEPIELPGCIRGMQPKAGMCIDPKPVAGKKSYNGTAKVVFACCEQPSWAAHSVFDVEVVEGRLERIFFITGGAAVQGSALAALKLKFGPPTSLASTPMQNGFGARFDSVEATWATQGVVVDFRGAVPGTESGLVTIETPKGRDAAHDRAVMAPARRGL